MKKIIILCMLLTIQKVQAQMDPLQAQYVNTPMVINPAYAGLTRDLNLAVDYRKQWAGFDGSPRTFSASGHMAINKNKMGLGLLAVQDHVGSNTTTEMEAIYSYHLPVNNETTLSFGLQFGAINYQTDYSELIVAPNDPKLETANEWQPNFGAGLILTNDVYFLSFSLPKMLKPSTETASQGLYNRSLYLMGGYNFTLSSRLRLKPYALLRAATDTKSSYDVGINLLGDDSYVVGAFTRSFHTYGLMAQLRLDELLRVGYVFELPTNQSAGTQYTTHELQLIMRLRMTEFHDLTRVRSF
ncbi:MAG: type IX secretion system membrane protein PorP/SprF [Cyclobacteriaceae bacterium]|nr:type IX secretion system membrane protein PorP/SprF [Cyclobacteriaceae bacterium]